MSALHPAMSKPPPKRHQLTDAAVAAIIELLSGKLKKNSAEEHDARGALAWAFRHPADANLGIWIELANMVDPKMENTTAGRLRFVANSDKTDNHREIAEFIWHRVQEGTKREAVYREAAAKFDISPSQAFKSFHKWEKHYKRSGPRLRGLMKAYRKDSDDSETT
jgi:hypothetical protein